MGFSVGNTLGETVNFEGAPIESFHHHASQADLADNRVAPSFIIKRPCAKHELK